MANVMRAHPAPTLTPIESIIPHRVLAKFSYDDYWRDEWRVFKPWLESQGFHVVAFTDGDRDSLGPLSRIVTVFRQSKRFDLVYFREGGELNPGKA